MLLNTLKENIELWIASILAPIILIAPQIVVQAEFLTIPPQETYKVARGEINHLAETKGARKGFFKLEGSDVTLTFRCAEYDRKVNKGCIKAVQALHEKRVTVKYVERFSRTHPSLIVMSLYNESSGQEVFSPRDVIAPTRDSIHAAVVTIITVAVLVGVLIFVVPSFFRRNKKGMHNS